MTCRLQIFCSTTMHVCSGTIGPAKWMRIVELHDIPTASSEVNFD
jgi:hypothetical protein